MGEASPNGQYNDRMWRFVQVSDPHLGSLRDGVWNNGFICTMMPDVIRCLRRDLAALKPDFILATGDIASHDSRDAVFAARDLMDSLDVPYFPMGGNHDFAAPQSRNWFLEAFHAQLPVRKTYYDFDWKNLHFCVLDAWWLWSDGTLSDISERNIAVRQEESLNGARWALPKEQLDWLDANLAKHAGKPTVIACHYPAVPIPSRLRRPGMKDGGCLENGAELLVVLKRHPQVKSIFSGHVHMHFIERVNGVTQITTGAMPEYPSEYREVRVYDDRMEVVTVGLSDPSFAARSLIPGHGWTGGQTVDRSTVISLA